MSQKIFLKKSGNPDIYVYVYILVVISDARYTECSNLTEARWVYYIFNHENSVPPPPSPVVTTVALRQLMHLGT